MSFFHDLLCNVWQGAAMVNDKVFRHGCDFSRWVTADSIGFSPERGNQYQPSSGNMVNVLRRYAITKDDAVLDIGCGKGKVMYLLCRFPFGKIDGIDLSPELVRIANDNFSHLGGGGSRCHAFAADAADFDGYDDYNYFYMFNTLPEKVLEQTLHHIEESIRRRPRRCVLVYANPVCADVLEKSSVFSLAYTHRSLFAWQESRCYEADPRPAAPRH